MKTTVTNDLGPLHPQMASIVVLPDGAGAFIASANVPTFGPEVVAKMRQCVRMYLGARTKIDWTNLRSERNLCRVQVMANCNLSFA